MLSTYKDHKQCDHVVSPHTQNLGKKIHTLNIFQVHENVNNVKKTATSTPEGNCKSPELVLLSIRTIMWL